MATSISKKLNSGIKKLSKVWFDCNFKSDSDSKSEEEGGFVHGVSDLEKTTTTTVKTLFYMVFVSKKDDKGDEILLC